MGRWRRWAALAAGMASGVWAATPAEQNPHLGRALAHIEAGELEAAQKALNQAMGFPQNSNRILVEIYRNLAVVHFYSGDESSAYTAFARVLNIDLEYQLPATTAKPLKALFEKVREAYRDGHLKPVRVAHDPPWAALPDTQVNILATISNMEPGFSARVHWRVQGEETYTSVDLEPRPGHRYAVNLPAQSVDATSPQGKIVEYYLEVTDAQDRRVQGRGSAFKPLTYLVENPSAHPPGVTPSWYENPIVWVVVGVVVVGASVGAVVASGGSSGGTVPILIKTQ